MDFNFSAMGGEKSLHMARGSSHLPLQHKTFMSRYVWVLANHTDSAGDPKFNCQTPPGLSFERLVPL